MKKLVYEKYIKRGGKLHGPYYYKSVRDSKGKIKHIYLGTINPEQKKTVTTQLKPKFSSPKFTLKTVAFIFLILGLTLISYSFLENEFSTVTGHVILDIHRNVSSEAYLIIDGISQSIPLEVSQDQEGNFYFDITQLELELSPGEHLIQLMDNNDVIYETIITVEGELEPIETPQPLPEENGTNPELPAQTFEEIPVNETPLIPEPTNQTLNETIVPHNQTTLNETNPLLANKTGAQARARVGLDLFLPIVPNRREINFFEHKYSNIDEVYVTTPQNIHCNWGDPLDPYKKCTAIFTIDNRNLVAAIALDPSISVNFSSPTIRNLNISFANTYLLTNHTTVNTTLDENNDTITRQYNYSVLSFRDYRNVPTTINTANPFSIRIDYEDLKQSSNQFNLTITSLGFSTFIDPSQSSCGTLGQNTGEAYTLSQSVSTAQTCFNIVNNSVILDCQSFNITYATAGDQVAYGVNVTGFSNVTIKNCNIMEGNPITNSKHAITISGGSANNTIRNNTIRIIGTGSEAIVITANSSNIIGNNITSTNTSAIGIDLDLPSDFNLVENNSLNMTSTGTAINFGGGSDNNTARGNKAICVSATSCVLLGSAARDNVLDSNTITSTSNRAIRFVTSTNRTLLLNNNFTASAEEILDSNPVGYENYLVYNNSLAEVKWTEFKFREDLTTDGRIANIGFGLGRQLFLLNRTVAFNHTFFTTGNISNSTVNITMFGLNLTNVTNILYVPYFDTDYGNVTQSTLATDCTTRFCQIISYNPATGNLIFNSTQLNGTFVANGTYPTTVSCGANLTTSATLSNADPITSTICTGYGINISANNIVLDCAGFTITGDGGRPNDNALLVNGRQNVTVKNCFFTSFGVSNNFNTSFSAQDINNSLFQNITVLSSESFVVVAQLINALNVTFNLTNFTTPSSSAIIFDMQNANYTRFYNFSLYTTGLNTRLLGIQQSFNNRFENLTSQGPVSTTLPVGLAGSSHNIFDNGNVVGTNRPAFSFQSLGAIRLPNNNNTVQNFYISTTTRAAIDFTRVTTSDDTGADNTFINNTIVTSFSEGIRLAPNTQNNTFKRNKFFTNSYPSFIFESNTTEGANHSIDVSNIDMDTNLSIYYIGPSLNGTIIQNKQIGALYLMFTRNHIIRHNNLSKAEEIFVSDSTNLTFLNNTLITNLTTRNGFTLLRTNNSIFYNNNLTLYNASNLLTLLVLNSSFNNTFQNTSLSLTSQNNTALAILDNSKYNAFKYFNITFGSVGTNLKSIQIERSGFTIFENLTLKAMCNNCSGISLIASSNNTFDNLDIFTTNGSSFKLEASSTTSSDNNTLKNSRLNTTLGTGITFQTIFSTDNDGSYNQFINISINTTLGIGIAGSGDKHTLYQDIIIRPIAARGISLGPRANNLTFERIIIEGTTAGGIFLNTGNHTFKDILINSSSNTCSETSGCDLRGNASLLSTSVINFTNLTIITPQINILNTNYHLSFTNLTLDNTTTTLFFPNVSWNNFAFVSEGNLSLRNNFAFINSSVLLPLNTSAKITFNNLFSSPRTNYSAFVDVEDDGTFVNCQSPRCINQLTNGATFTFNVSSWTAYTSQQLAIDCGANISTSLTLTGNDTIITTPCTGYGINITANNLILDCAGLTINGDGGQLNDNALLLIGKSNVTIKNCKFINFGRSLLYDGSLAWHGTNNSHMSNVTVFVHASNTTVQALNMSGSVNNTLNFTNFTAKTDSTAVVSLTLSFYNTFNNITSIRPNGTADQTPIGAQDPASFFIIESGYNIFANVTAATDYYVSDNHTHGIELFGAENNTFNCCFYNGSGNEGSAVLLTSGRNFNNTFTNNTFTTIAENGAVVRLDAGAANSFLNNTFRSVNVAPAILFRGINRTTLRDNKFFTGGGSSISFSGDSNIPEHFNHSLDVSNIEMDSNGSIYYFGPQDNHRDITEKVIGQLMVFHSRNLTFRSNNMSRIDDVIVQDAENISIFNSLIRTQSTRTTGLLYIRTNNSYLFDINVSVTQTLAAFFMNSTNITIRNSSFIGRTNGSSVNLFQSNYLIFSNVTAINTATDGTAFQLTSSDHNFFYNITALSSLRRNSGLILSESSHNYFNCCSVNGTDNRTTLFVNYGQNNSFNNLSFIKFYGENATILLSNSRGNQFNGLSINITNSTAIFTSNESNDIFRNVFISSIYGTGVHLGANDSNLTFEKLIIEHTNGTGILLHSGNHTFRDLYINSSSVNCTEISGCDLRGNNTVSARSTLIFINTTLVTPQILFLDTEYNISFTNLSLENVTTNLRYPNISWHDFSFVSEGNLSLSFNRTFVNSTVITPLNQSAQLTFRNITGTEAQALVDFNDDGIFALCPNNICTAESLDVTAGIFTYNVSGFTTYAVEATNEAPRTILILPEDNAVNVTNTLQFVCNATDNTGLSNITLLTNTTGPFIVNQTSLVTGLTNQSTFTLTNIPTGTYLWTCEARDSNNNYGINGTNRTFTVDPLPPSASVSALPASITTAESSTISCTGSDNFRVDSVVVTEPGTGTICTGSSSCSALFSTASPATYTFTCTATDAAGNTATSQTTLDVTTAGGGGPPPPAPPPAPPSGGGGGGGGGGSGRGNGTDPLVVTIGGGGNITATIGRRGTIQFSIVQEPDGTKRPKLDLSFDVEETLKDYKSYDLVYINPLVYLLLLVIVATFLHGSRIGYTFVRTEIGTLTPDLFKPYPLPPKRERTEQIIRSYDLEPLYLQVETLEYLLEAKEFKEAGKLLVDVERLTTKYKAQLTDHQELKERIMLIDEALKSHKKRKR